MAETDTRSKTPRWKPLLAGLALAGLGASFGFLAARSGMALGPIRASLDALSPWDLLALPVLVLFVLAVHEAGHLAGGMSRGMRFLLFIAGPFGWVRTQQGVRFRWFFNLGTLGGVAAALPVPDAPLRPQLSRLVLGGPLASLALAMVGFAAFAGLEGRAGAYALILGGLSAAIFLVTAAPLRSGGFMSDGMQFLQLHRNPAMVERRARLLALMGMSLAGTRPRDLDPAMLAQAQAITGDEALYDIGVWLYSYAKALDQGDGPAADAWIERIEPVFSQYPDGFRQGLAIELAIHEATYRRRLPPASAWLAQAGGGVVDASRRHLAQAAVAALKGERDTALQQLDVAEARLGRSMDPGFAAMGGDQIGQLRGSLQDPGLLRP